LTHAGLAQTVMHGVLRYLQARLEAGLATHNETVATLLVGSGDEDLALQEVIEAILTGVHLANEALRSRDRQATTSVAKLQFIEWQYDLALEARWTLDTLEKTLDVPFTLSSELLCIDGGVKRLYRGQNDLWWMSLHVTHEEGKPDTEDVHDKLIFSAGGGRAMALRDDVLVCFDEIERRLKALFSGDRAASAQAQRTLFEQLVPSRFKVYASQKRNLLLTLDPDVAFIPWELLVDRNSLRGDPVSIEAGMLRRIERDPKDKRPFKPLADTRRALVVGNPPAPRAGYQHLPGAEHEAHAIAERLGSAPRWRAEKRIYSEGASGERAEREIMSEVLTGDYEILHFAAHGNYVKDNDRESGVVIGEDLTQTHVRDSNNGFPPALYFQTRHIKQLRQMPSLVFLNCCHTGTVGRGDGSHKLSASLAAEFMKEGAQAVVAASWAIDDNDALTFAQHFYDEMLAGKPFGDAVKKARKSIFRKGVNTWAAFQCYGDPGFTLSSQQSVSSGTVIRYQHVDEVVNDLANIDSELRAYHKAGLRVGDWLKGRLQGIEAAATRERRGANPPRYADEPAVIYALALAYGQFGDWDLARHWLERAMETDGSANSLEEILRVRDYRIRSLEHDARQLAEADANTAAQMRRLHKSAEAIAKSVETLTTIASMDAKLLEHIGAAWKIVAMMGAYAGDGKRASIALKNSGKAYVDAYDLRRESSPDAMHYSGTSALVVEGLLRCQSARKPGAKRIALYKDMVSEVGTYFKQRANTSSKDTRDLFAPLEFELACWVLTGDKNNLALKELSAKLSDRFHSDGSAGQRDSVIKQLRLCAQFIDAERRAAVEDLISALSS
ncbi:MAG: CHAT domain-containing protein, partial [Pseudomonadota bacterium]